MFSSTRYRARLQNLHNLYKNLYTVLYFFYLRITFNSTTNIVIFKFRFYICARDLVDENIVLLCFDCMYM
jgi:hypothetical protein